MLSDLICARLQGQCSLRIEMVMGVIDGQHVPTQSQMILGSNNCRILSGYFSQGHIKNNNMAYFKKNIFQYKVFTTILHLKSRP